MTLVPREWKELDVAELAVPRGDLKAGTPVTIVDTDPDCFLVEISDDYARPGDTMDERLFRVEPHEIRERDGHA